MIQKKTYEELHAEAQVLLAEVSALETQWESESDPQKLAKLESKIDRVETRRDRLYGRMDKISDTESQVEPDVVPKKKEENPEEEYTCKDCGGDLKEIEDGVYECVNCGEVWETDGK